MSFILTNGVYVKSPLTFEARPVGDWLVWLCVVALVTLLSYALGYVFRRD